MLQITIVDVENIKLEYLREYLPWLVKPTEYVGKKLLAVPICCRNVPGTSDCEWVNRAVAERDRGVLKRKEINSAVMDSVNRGVASFLHRNYPEKLEDQKTSFQSFDGRIEDLNLNSLAIKDVSHNLTHRAQNLNDVSKKKLHYGEPLQKGEIRLLQLQPGSIDDPIVCSLILSSLESTPFEAVSYVWGSEDNPHPITCNWAIPSFDDEGIKVACPTAVTNNMTVTENLYNLLLRIRDPENMRIL